MKEYKIAHRGLGEGVHTFEFVMDDGFFDCFDATKGTKGKVNARVNIGEVILANGGSDDDRRDS